MDTQKPDAANNADSIVFRTAWEIEQERLERKRMMLETALSAFDPVLFGTDALAAHMAASPITVEAAQKPIRLAMREALIAIKVLSRPGEHASDCAVYNEPAKRNKPCDCGASPPVALTQA